MTGNQKVTKIIFFYLFFPLSGVLEEICGGNLGCQIYGVVCIIWFMFCCFFYSNLDFFFLVRCQHGGVFFCWWVTLQSRVEQQSEIGQRGAIGKNLERHLYPMKSKV